MSKNLSAKYYQENTERLQKRLHTYSCLYVYVCPPP